MPVMGVSRALNTGKNKFPSRDTAGELQAVDKPNGTIANFRRVCRERS